MRISFLVLAAFVLPYLAGCATAPVTDGRFDPQQAAILRDGGTAEWAYDLDEDGRVDFRELDRDGDGVIDVYQFDTDGDGVIDHITSRSVLLDRADRTFILFVDGVPLEDLQTLWDEGHFREFFRPSGMISPFPSMTYVSFADILGTPKPPGYEELYYHREKQQLVGGLRGRLGGEEAKADKEKTFLTRLGYTQPSVYSGLIYVTTIGTAQVDLKNAMEYFDNLETNMGIAYVGTSDGVAHKLGREAIRDILHDIDQVLRRFIFEHRGRLRIVFASDHGNNYVPSERIDFEEALAANGFRLAGSVEDSAAVVIPAYGLVGFAAAYVEPERRRDLATAAIDIPGVDLAVFEEAGEVRVLGNGERGEAIIRHDVERNAFHYDMREGDPLDLAEVMRQLEETGAVDARGFVGDRDWFDATKSHRYPDAVQRVYLAARDHVENPADVILSFDDQHFYGSRFFDFLVELTGTHGNLLETSTLGFLMCNYLPPPDYIRAADMRNCLDLAPPDVQLGGESE
jgi:hypothetical protein